MPVKRSSLHSPSSLNEKTATAVKVLVADDTVTDRLILERLVKQFGYPVVSAGDGAQAVEAYAKERPDIVLLDVLMPTMDGFEAARQIRAIAGEEFVPIIFLTSLSDTDSLVKCLDAGGDDFLSKPYNKVILQAKISAFARMRSMQTTILSQRDKIAQHNNELIREQNIAKAVFDNIAHSGCLNAANIQYYLSPLSIFNGDVLVAGVRPSGNIMALLGDFTGHGLPAAMGSIPLATTFYGMVGKGFSLVDIAREINRKLKDILPVGMFCCASMVDIDFRERNIKVWSGGLPPGYLYRAKDGSITPLDSRNLPLGILSDKDFKARFERYELSLGDRVFLWSDGVHEARNPAGEMFGEERLLNVFKNQPKPENLLNSIVDNVHQFMGEHERDDDLTVFGIEIVDSDAIQATVVTPQLHEEGLVDWSMEFELRASTFSGFNPLPILVNILNEVRGLRGHTSDLYTILAELYSNALEHGVLGLSSSLKQDPDGFLHYYELRKQRLSETKEGFVRFALAHEKIAADVPSGRLKITVTDSGEGFNEVDALNEMMKTDQDTAGRFSGRGIKLLNSICDEVVYHGKGNHVEVIFSWEEREE